MAHYAFLDGNSVVTLVIVGKDEGENGVDWEQFYADEIGQTCKRTSYNTYGGVHILGGTPFRKNYAGIGFSYDASQDAFIPPKPFASWLLNETTCLWEAPTVMPDDGNEYIWDEATTSWVAV